MGAIEFRVLGPVEVVLDGFGARLGSPIQRTLLAMLLTRPGEVVPTDRIVEAIWRDDPHEGRRKLWFHVSKLRRILRPDEPGDAQTVLVSRPTGYALRVRADQLDASRFESLANSARAKLQDDPAGAAETLRAALALWRGEPFEDVLHEDAVSAEIARLSELRLAALEDRLAADLAAGLGAELIPELEALVGQHPFREHFRTQLMLALYRAGRQADALEAYRAARRTLVDELGIEPSEELKDLQRRILAQDPGLAGTRQAPRAAEAPAGPPREERKVVTVFFADLVDFTATAEQLDPEDGRAFLTPYYTRIRSELERFGGSVEKFVGDAVMAIFGAPVAHEDDPERAVRAALAIRDWLDEQGGPQQARIAVATGEAHVSVGTRASAGEPVAVGDVVNTAARLQAAAPVNGVLVGEQTFRATRDAVEYRDAGTVAAKGKREPIRVWEAIRVRTRPGERAGYASPFVGREREFAVLQERLAWAVAEPAPQLVTILGVPGIGKSRLVSELRQAAVRSGSPLTWLHGRSLPYGDGVSFWALGEIVKEHAGILESDTAEQAERELRRAVDSIVPDPAEASRIALSLGALVGLGGGEGSAGGRRDTFADWYRFMEVLAEERLLVLAFEDMHWADDGLLDFVDELVDRMAGVPLVVVVVGRPELLERRPGWAGGKPNALTISLPPLSRGDTARLVAALLEETEFQAEADAALLEHVGGNPLFAEQFCRALLERGRLEEVPETVHGIIAARLDGLPRDERGVLDEAAVVGKVFWAGAVEAIGGIPRQRVKELLHSLARREFVQRVRRSSIADDEEYAFRHELLRDVAYGAIPRAARAGRHRLAAEWIESVGRPEDLAELLAHHYLGALERPDAAGEDPASLAERARLALHRAALRAIRLSANDRAVDYLTRAIALIELLPEGDERSRTEAELQLQLGIASFALRGFSAPEVEQAYVRATELVMAIAPAAEQFPIHFGLCIHHCQRGNFAQAAALVERMTELATEGDESMRLQALHSRWALSLFSGRIDNAVAVADEGLAIYRPDVHHQLSFRYANHDPGVCALSHQAIALALRGDSATAVEQMQKAVELSEALGHAVSRAEPLSYLPWILQIDGDADAALDAAERALALEGEVVHPVFFAIAHAMRGWALSRLGRHAEGVPELERALADQLRVASYINAVLIGAFLAEAHLRYERPEAARAVIDEMRPLAESMQTYSFEPELLRVEAEWLRLAGQKHDARQLLLRAVEIARKQGSWALAVRAAIRLVQIPSTERESDLGRLAGLCDRLPPQNDTEYGREAKALIGGAIATAMLQ